MCSIFTKTLIFVFVTVVFGKNFDQSSRFKSVKCINNSTERHKIHLCKIKVTRNSSFLAFNVSIKRTIDKPLYLRATAFYKYGLIYRQITPIPEIEVCSMLKNVKSAHPFLLAWIETLGETLKPLLKGCPYLGNYNVTLSVDTRQLPSIFPSGMYKAEIFISTPDKKFVAVIVQLEIVSSIKTSF